MSMTAVPCEGSPDGRHIGTVVYTHRWRDLFRKRYWIRCYECNLRMGPFYYRPDPSNIRYGR